MFLSLARPENNVLLPVLAAELPTALLAATLFWLSSARLQALNLRGCARVSSSCLKHLSVLTGLTDLCLLHNSRLEMDDACLASLAKLPNLQILGLGNFQVC
jgi:hypothetical protein